MVSPAFQHVVRGTERTFEVRVFRLCTCDAVWGTALLTRKRPVQGPVTKFTTAALVAGNSTVEETQISEVYKSPRAVQYAMLFAICCMRKPRAEGERTEKWQRSIGLLPFPHAPMQGGGRPIFTWIAGWCPDAERSYAQPPGSNPAHITASRTSPLALPGRRKCSRLTHCCARTLAGPDLLNPVGPGGDLKGSIAQQTPHVALEKILLQLVGDQADVPRQALKSMCGFVNAWPLLQLHPSQGQSAVGSGAFAELIVQADPRDNSDAARVARCLLLTCRQLVEFSVRSVLDAHEFWLPLTGSADVAIDDRDAHLAQHVERLRSMGRPLVGKDGRDTAKLLEALMWCSAANQAVGVTADADAVMVLTGDVSQQPESLQAGCLEFIRLAAFTTPQLGLFGAHNMVAVTGIHGCNLLWLAETQLHFTQIGKACLRLLDKDGLAVDMSRQNTTWALRMRDVHADIFDGSRRARQEVLSQVLSSMQHDSRLSTDAALKLYSDLVADESVKLNDVAGIEKLVSRIHEAVFKKFGDAAEGAQAPLPMVPAWMTEGTEVRQDEVVD